MFYLINFKKKNYNFYNEKFIFLYCRLSYQFAAVLDDVTCTSIVLDMTPCTIIPPQNLAFQNKIQIKSKQAVIWKRISNNMEERRLDSSGSQKGLAVGCHGHGNEPHGSIKCWEFLH
jgi:hypothetical protein